jgi:hypothetical protein
VSEHVTRIIRHDVASCNTARHANGGDCGTRYEAHCSCGWGQGASSQEAADALAVGHRSYSPRAEVIVTSAIPQTSKPRAEITDEQLRELFGRHCECRPLDLARVEGDHAAIHDCDTGILHDIQIALGIVLFDDIGRIQSMREARERCAEVFDRLHMQKGT